MKLRSFRVRDYRSVNDSGSIEVGQRTALVGRNESGKTNLLLALESLKPADGWEELTFVKDFPRDRRRSKYSETIAFLETRWELTEQERGELGEIFPRAKDVTEVIVQREYRKKRLISFKGLPSLAVDQTLVGENLAKLGRSLTGSLRGKTAAISSKAKQALTTLSDELNSGINRPKDWADNARTAIDSFRGTLVSLQLSVSDQADNSLEEIKAHVEKIQHDNDAHNSAIRWVVTQIPTFVYLNDYPQVEGHQNINEFMHRRDQGIPTEADKNFAKLAKVADLDPDELARLLQQSYEERQLLTNRAGSVVTQKIRQLWTDRQLTIRFNLDAEHFDTLVSDPNAVYPVEVNLNDRSRGFKWFFSFYMTFAADTAGGPAEKAILLLDEPGLHLHALAQRNLLDHFKNDFDNQIIYTTHSPFMVPTEELSSVRTVNIDAENGTTVTNNPTGDERTLFPLQAALGYDLTQTLFIGEQNLIVEGVSDFWYLSSISDYLNDQNGSGFPPELVLTPAGGAQRVSYMVALLTSQRLRVLVLLDDEQQARNAGEELVKSKLTRDENVVFTSEAFDAPPTGGADVEDLLDPDVFHRLVEETYMEELEGKTLSLNSQIPRIVKRYQEAFKMIGLTFNKTRPAKLFLRRAAEDMESILPDVSRNRFTKLFRTVTDRMEAQVRRNRAPFT